MRRLATFTMVSGGVIYLVATGLTAEPFGLEILAVALIFGIYAAGLDLSWGYGGILLLGSALFFGIGAYGMGFALRADLEPFIAYPLVIGTAVLVSLVIAAAGFRVRASQIHFGLIGLALALAMQRVTVSAYEITGGSNGLTGLRRPIIAGVIDLTSAQAYYFFVVGMALATVALLYHLQRSAWGDAVRALKDDEVRAISLGYSVFRLKLQVVALSAAIISLAGALFSPATGTAYPALFGIVQNMQALVWVALGGVGTLFGPFITATVLRVFQNYLGGVMIDYYLLVIGLIFVAVVVTAPRGVGGLILTLIERIPNRLPSGRLRATRFSKE